MTAGPLAIPKATLVEPLGVVTTMLPEVAPAGMVTTSVFADPDTMVAVTPLNVTVFWELEKVQD